jgi:ketosteroid isomerase-like protein
MYEWHGASAKLKRSPREDWAMPRFVCFAVIAATSACLVAPSSAQEQPAAEDAVHDELRSFRDQFLKAFEEKDIDAMLGLTTNDVVITVQNAETLRGHDDVRDFHERMSGGEEPQVQLLKTDFEVDDLSIIHGGDTAIAFGKMDDHFKLKAGMEFDLHSRWTAMLVKTDAGWRLAAFQISTNMFDNGVSRLQTQWASLKSGGIALVAGLLVGILGGVWLKRRQTPATAA